MIIVKKNLLILISAIILSVGSSNAQVKTPAPSPDASVSQVIGVTKVKIKYSSPGVKGREGKIWGELLPFGVAWRAGANAATKITFKNDVTINDKKVEKGSYSLFITPKKEGKWMFHLNKGSGVFEYMEKGKVNSEKLMKNDVVTVMADAKDMPSQERLQYSITPLSDSEGMVSMHWEKKKVSFNFSVNTKELVEKSIEDYSNSSWAEYRKSASYYLDNGDLKKAMKHVNASISLKGDHFWNTWVKAQIYAAKDMTEEALKWGEKAIKLGKEGDGPYSFFKSQIEKDIKEWKSKS